MSILARGGILPELRQRSIRVAEYLTLVFPHVTIVTAVSFSFIDLQLLPHAKALGLATHLSRNSSEPVDVILREIGFGMSAD